MKLIKAAILLQVLLTSYPIFSLELDVNQKIKVSKGPNRALVLDMNNSGSVKVLISSHPDGTVSLLDFNNKGDIVSSKIYSVGINPTEIVAYDMNRDGYQDILIANHETNSFHILYNDKKGGFDGEGIKKFSVETKPHIHTLGAGDFNGDKIPDVVIDSWENSQLAIYYGTKDGQFNLKPTVICVSEQPRTNLVTGDLDQDELTDIVTPASRNGGASVVLGKNINSSKLIKNADKAFKVLMADANGDGNNDILTIHRGSNFNDADGEGISLLLGNGKGDFKMAKGFPITISGAPSSINVGDLNGDDYPEIITTNYRTNNVTVVFYEQQSKNYRQKSYPVGDRPESVAIGDIDGDGLNEVILANRESDSISLLRFLHHEN